MRIKLQNVHPKHHFCSSVFPSTIHSIYSLPGRLYFLTAGTSSQARISEAILMQTTSMRWRQAPPLSRAFLHLNQAGLEETTQRLARPPLSPATALPGTAATIPLLLTARGSPRRTVLHRPPTGSVQLWIQCHRSLHQKFR